MVLDNTFFGIPPYFFFFFTLNELRKQTYSEVGKQELWYLWMEVKIGTTFMESLLWCLTNYKTDTLDLEI